MEKREPNVNLADQVILLIVSFSFLFFHFFIFLFFDVKNGVTPLYIAAQGGHEQVVEILLEKREPNVNLADQVILLIVSFSFFFFHFFIFLFFDVKNGVTPLYIAAQGGHEQVVEILLEKGKPNVDLANQVILLIISYFSFFFFHFLIFLFFLM